MEPPRRANFVPGKRKGWSWWRSLAFAGLALVVFPHIIPMSVTIYQAAAAPSALVFMIIFMGFLIPIMLAYNIFQYVVFRGKVTGGHYE
nr:cytochrome d ubiquinol oxidase subunit II [Gloeobacter violaceus]